MPTFLRLALVVLAAAVAASVTAEGQDSFRFRSGIELINVTATVTDDDGRFVSGLTKEDFVVYEDGERQEVTHFSSERVPVSLGIMVDSSGSMTPDKMASARSAIDRFIYDLLGPDDELFLAEFSNRMRVAQSWTTDRRAVSRAMARINAAGGTAMYDAIADILPAAAAGRHSKKALLVISDGNDTNSNMSVGELRQMIRESEVLVYALGVDGRTSRGPSVQLPVPLPFPVPGGGSSRRRPPVIIGGSPGAGSERVNADALRQITDDTGGRTEIVRGFADLDGATSRIADELSKQYYLGYASTREKDGRWHNIRVEVRDRRMSVRARRGYVAS